MNANDPAFPTLTDQRGNSFAEKRVDADAVASFTVIHHSGMTLRAYFAGQAMFGLLANKDWTDDKLIIEDAGIHAKASVAAADALIAELNKESIP